MLKQLAGFLDVTIFCSQRHATLENNLPFITCVQKDSPYTTAPLGMLHSRKHSQNARLTIANTCQLRDGITLAHYYFSMDKWRHRVMTKRIRKVKQS